MAYTITRTNGLNPIVIPDGQINTSTSVTLVGKNYPNYGAILDQNFLRMLENSASGNRPDAPITGQLWWDTTNKILKVNIDGGTGSSSWKNVGSTTAQASKPTGNNNVGDLWWDTTNGQLWAYDSNSLDYKLIGPIGGSGGISSESISDGITTHPVISFNIGGSRYAILSNSAAFTPNVAISGFQTIRPGLNLANTNFLTNGRFTGTATIADTLAASPSNLTAVQFMRSDVNTSTTGTVSVTNNSGVTIGTSSNLKLSVTAPNVAVTNQTQSGSMNFKVTNSSNTVLNAMDIYPNGNVVANFDLTVAGNISFTNSANDLVISGVSPSINTSTGALRLSVGGMGIAGNINTGGSQNNFVGQVKAASIVSNSSITGQSIGNTGTMLTGTLTTASATQGNITAVGTLTSLTVTGLSSLNGGIAGTINTNAQPYITSVGSLGGLTATSIVDFTGATQVKLGANTNVKLTGGSAGQYLVTDGSGNISWSSITGSNNQVPYFQSGILAGSSSLTYNGSTFAVTGAITATGDITAYASDIRLKTDIEPITDALNKVCSLKGFTYNFNELAASIGITSQGRQAGVSAQDVQAVLPEVVKPAPADSEYLTVQYEKLTAILIEAIKELRAEVEALKNR